jgi:ribosomal protein S18 acetylase RimI-like enzyme
MVIEPYDDSMLDGIVRVSLRAWHPVFESLSAAMGPELFRAFYRDDWREAQRGAVESVCADENVHVWVASEEAQIAGFVVLKVHREDRMGEIYMIAVDPDFQRRGIASKLTSHSVEWFENAGMSVVMVETGGDPGHAPARRTYESSGFRLFPVARYFKTL